MLQLHPFLSLEPLGGEWSACSVPVLPLGKESPVPIEYRAGWSAIARFQTMIH
jgi:hypothetical protein